MKESRAGRLRPSPPSRRKKELGLATDTEALPTVDDITVATRWALVVGAGLIALAAVLHLLAWVSLVFPGVSGGLGITQFGRLKPMADITLTFGAFYFVNTGALYLLLPRLTGTILRDSRLAKLNTLWALGIVTAAIVSVGLGLGDGRFGFEMPLILDALYLSALVLPAWIFRRALRDRTEALLHPTVWALTAAFLALAFAVVVANFPLTEATGAWIQGAFGRSVLLWTWLLGSVVGISWYVVPKAAGRPLFSRQLAQIVFGSLVLLPTAAGLAGLTFGPVADWAETIGVVFRFSLLVPALAIPAGILATVSGTGGNRVVVSPALQAALAGSWLLAAGGVATALTAVPYVQSVVGLTTFEDGTLALLVGAGTLFAASFVYHSIPAVTGRPLASNSLAFDHTRLIVWGSAVTALFLWYAGIHVGAGFRAGALGGLWTAVGDGFGEATDGVVPLYMLALLGLGLVAAGQVIFLVNTLRSVGRKTPTVPTEEVFE